jgi:hypothetical protein
MLLTLLCALPTFGATRLLHAGISIETLTEIALRLAMNSGSFRCVRFALRRRDLLEESHVIAGYNININRVRRS